MNGAASAMIAVCPHKKGYHSAVRDELFGVAISALKGKFQQLDLDWTMVKHSPAFEVSRLSEFTTQFSDFYRRQCNMCLVKSARH